MTASFDLQLDHDDHVPSGQRYPLSLLAHDIEDAANTGSLFRLADALGIEHLYLTGKTVVPPDRKLSKAARSTEAAVPHSAGQHPLEVITSLRTDGYTILALELSIASVDLREVMPAKDDRICLLLGNENFGIEDALLEACDQSVHVPMLGQNSSMNVAMAAAIACWELTRRMRPYSIDGK